MSSASSNRWSVLVVTGAALVLSLTTWYSATAIVPELTLLMSLSLSQVAWFTNGVRVGFVVGALSLSLLFLLDIYKSSTIMAMSACIAGIANAILILEPGIALSLFSRFITGMALAGIYPTVIKFIATWFKNGRGFAIKIFVSWLLPVIAEHHGSWCLSFLILVPGPFLGALSMLLLRREARSHLVADSRR